MWAGTLWVRLPQGGFESYATLTGDYTVENIRFSEEGFSGLNAGVSPDNIPEGYVAVAENVFLDGIGGSGGADLTTRPGKRGIWSALAESIWPGALSYRKTDGMQWIYFVTGGGEDEAGKVYGTQKNSSSKTHLSALGGFKESQTQFVRFGKWVFASGATDGELRRFDPNSPSAPYGCAGIATPSYRPTATITNKTLYDAQSPTPVAIFSDDAKFAADEITSGSISIDDADFAAASTSSEVAPNDLSPNAWVVIGGSVEAEAALFIDPDNPTRKYVRLDEAGSGIKTADAAVMDNVVKTNSNGTGPARYAVHHRLDCRFRSTFITDTIDVSLIACGAMGNEIGRTTETIEALGSQVISDRSVYLSLAGVVDDTAPVKLRLEFVAGVKNHPSIDTTPDGGPFIGHLSLTAIEPAVVFTSGVNGVDVSAYYSATSPAQPSDRVLLGQTHLAYDLDSTVTTLDSVSRVAIPIKRYFDFEFPRVRLVLRETSSDSDPAYTDDLQLVEDADGREYLAGDLSVIDPTEISDVTHIDIVFLDDFAMPEGPGNTGQVLFSVGSLVEAGGLSVGETPYEYRFCEKDGTTGIISGGGPLSDAISPLDFKASASLSLSHVPSLAADSAANRLVLYRRGGTIDDGFFRKISEFDPDTAGAGDYWEWDETTKIFTDRTPDTALQAAETGSTVSDTDFFFSDHQGAPSGFKSICVRDGRLYGVTDDELWVSQLTTVENAFGLYWNAVPDYSSKTLAIQGFKTRLSGNDGASTAGDSAKRLIVYREFVVAWYTGSRFIIGGNDATDYYVRRWEGDEGRGLLAPGAITVYDGLCWYLAQDGLRAWDLVSDYRVSQKLDRLLTPKAVFDSSALTPAAFARSSLLASSGRLLLSVPAPGGSTIGVTYVLDLRAGNPIQGGGAWTSWLLGEVSGGVVLSGDGDSDDLYLTEGKAGVSHGQIYSVGSLWGDTLYPGNTVTPVNMRVRTRSFRQPGSELRAERLFLTTDCGVSRSATWTVSAGGVTGKTHTSVYVVPSGEQDVRRLKVPSNVRGRDLWVELFVPVADTPMSIKRLALEAQPGRAL